MARARSYICERSAEYVLVPELVNELRKTFKFVTALYPWVSREGSKISVEVNESKNFKVLGVYARSPKILSKEDSRIFVKINEDVINAAHKSWQLGIPMVAGCPLARNIFELSSCNNFLWVDLSKLPAEDKDLEVEINSDKYTSENYDRFIIHNINEIVRFVESECKLFDIKSLMCAIKEIKIASKKYNEYFSMMYIGGYKPIYIIMKN